MTRVLDGIELRTDDDGLIGWLSDWSAPFERDWFGRGFVTAEGHNSGGLGGLSYRLTPIGETHAGHSPRYICKWCGAESPTGIGYADSSIGPLPAPVTICPNPHASS